jgi:sulfotransferase
MVKKIHFLAGLPRSGNTLLSALLNQHPEIYSSSVSNLLSEMYAISQTEKQESYLLNENNEKRTKQALKSYAQNFYFDVDKPIIIDRDKSWGYAGNIDNYIKKYLSDKPKIIYTVRDIPEVIASTIAINKQGYLNDMKNDEYFNYSYLSDIDALTDYLMRPHGQINSCLLVLGTAFNPQYRDYFHLVEYSDLMVKTQETMDGIYSFLEIDGFEHDLSNIEKIEFENDEKLGFHPLKHHVRKTISASQTDPKQILSEYGMNKYSGTEFWRKESTIKVKGRDF